MVSGADPEQDWWRPLSHEERRRHEILFYNQGPMDGFLPGKDSPPPPHTHTDPPQPSAPAFGLQPLSSPGNTHLNFGCEVS